MLRITNCQFNSVQFRPPAMKTGLKVSRQCYKQGL